MTSQPPQKDPVTGKAILKCDYCDHTFSKRDHKKRHERSHTNTKPYVCEFCGRSYARSDVLGRHQQIHFPKGQNPSGEKSKRGSSAGNSNGNRGTIASASASARASTAGAPNTDSAGMNDSSQSSSHARRDSLTSEHMGVQLLQSLAQNRNSSNSKSSSPSNAYLHLPPSPHRNLYYQEQHQQHQSQSLHPSLDSSSAPTPPQYQRHGFDDFDEHEKLAAAHSLLYNHNNRSSSHNSPSQSTVHLSPHPHLSSSSQQFHHPNPHHYNNHPSPQHPPDFKLTQPPTFESSQHSPAPLSSSTNLRQQQQQNPPQQQQQNNSSSVRLTSRPHSPSSDAIDQIWQVPLLDFSSIVRPNSPGFGLNSPPPFNTFDTTPEYDTPNDPFTLYESGTANTSASSSSSSSYIATTRNTPATMSAMAAESNTPSAGMNQQEKAESKDNNNANTTMPTPANADSNTNSAGNADMNTPINEKPSTPMSNNANTTSIESRLQQQQRLVRNLWPTNPTKHPFTRPSLSTKNKTPRLIIDVATTNRLNSKLKICDKVFPLPLPTPFLYTELITLYFDHWHPVLPFLHRPTFDPQTSSSLLLLSMCALGTFFIDRPDAIKLGSAMAQPLILNITLSLSPALTNLTNLGPNEIERDVLQLVQASLLRHFWSLMAGDPDGMRNAKLYQVCPINVAQELGLFSPDYCIHVINNANNLKHDDNKQQQDQQQHQQQLELSWRKWAHCEVRKRTAYFFLFDDLAFSQLFINPPAFQSGAIDFPLPCADSLFAASSATSWSELVKITHDSVTPYHELAVSIFVDPHSVLSSPALTSLGMETLISSIFAVVLSSRANRRYRDIDLDESSEHVAPLTKALIESVPYIPRSGAEDEFAAGVLWNASWIHLLVDMKTIEKACGREGPTLQAHALERLQTWVHSYRARRLILHAIDIQMRIAERPSGVQSPPHLWISCFQAWMVIHTFLKLIPNPQDILVPWVRLDWKAIGSTGIGRLQANSMAPSPKSPDNTRTKIPTTATTSSPSAFINNTSRTNNRNINSASSSSTSSTSSTSSSSTSCKTSDLVVSINHWIMYNTQPQVPASCDIPSSLPGSNLELVKLVNVLEQFSGTLTSLGNLPIYENVANLIEIAIGQRLPEDQT